MPSERGSDRNYWRSYAAKKKAIARYDSGEPLTGCHKEDHDVLWGALRSGLRLARHHLRDGEYVHATYDVLAAIERADELFARGQQLVLSLLDTQAPLPGQQVPGDVD